MLFKLSCIGVVSADQIRPRIGHYKIFGYAFALGVHNTKIVLRNGICLLGS